MPDPDPLALVATALDKLAGSIDDALTLVRSNAEDLADTRQELGRWQRAIVILAVLFIGGWLTVIAVFSYARQGDCDRNNDVRRIVNQGPGADVPLRDCSWPS